MSAICTLSNIITSLPLDGLTAVQGFCFNLTHMERITLTFNISQTQKMDYDEASNLRKDISMRLDEALKEVRAGKWTGGMHTKDHIEIFLLVNDYDKALPVIQSTLNNHWLFPNMKIQRNSK